MKIAVNNQPWTSDTNVVEVFKGIPLKVAALFDTPPSEANLRILYIENSRWAANVPITQVTVARPVSPAPVLSPPVAQPINTSFSAVLTNCKPSVNGILVCTATLTPRK